MTPSSSTAIAHPNIAFIKYWGNKDHTLRIPTNNSISMNLDGLETRTIVTFDEKLSADTLQLNGEQLSGPALKRVNAFLEHVRELASNIGYAQVISENNFPTGAGIASSASAFAALALAASDAAGLNLKESQLSALARQGSGSASRSIPAGYVEWEAGDMHENSVAHSIAAPDHWALSDCIAVVSQSHKHTGSTQGHEIADTSPLQSARIADAPRRLDICRTALLERDFSTFSEIVELDNNLMHAVMMTSTPQLMYWQPATLAVIHAVKSWRAEGLEVCYTIDAGPNVHVICPSEIQPQVEEQLVELEGVIEVITAQPGGPARLV